MKEIELYLNHLDCANCAAKIEQQAAKVAGVDEVNVNFTKQRLYARIHGDEEVIKQELIHLIHRIEPDVDVQDLCASTHASANFDHHHSTFHGETCGHHPHEEHHHSHCDCGTEANQRERILVSAIKFRIDHLDCANCAQKVEDAIKKAPHVVDAAVNFSSSLLFVQTDIQESEAALLARLAEIVQAVEDGVVLSMPEGEQAKINHHSNTREYIRLGISLVLFIFGEVSLAQQWTWGVWLLLAALLCSGLPVFQKALRNILHGEVFDENFLMSIAAVGAFAIGEWGEGSAVMIFYEIGELFQAYAVNRSRRNIAELMNIKAEYANVLVDGKECAFAPKDVHVDDVMVVRPGERVALDGIILQGESSLDTSALSGESMPRDVGVADEILAGSVNISGLLHVRVTKELQESTVSRILELVENAGSRKAPMEQFITKFARVYTPLVVGLAVALLIAGMVFTPDAQFYDWLYRALTFLVVSCPCALVVSIPLALFAGIGGAGRKGILVKGGNYLEALSEVKTVVFDKTGTLTKGSFQVERVVAHVGSEAQLLELGAYGEAFSTHPIARSIVSAYGKAIDKQRIHAFAELAGNGVHVQIDGESYYMGNDKLMQAQGIVCAQDLPHGTIVHIASKQSYFGYLVINDEIKPTAKEAIRALRHEGVSKCVMLSGDRKESAEWVGNSLGLDEVYAQLLPQDKVSRLEELLDLRSSGKLAFVGDGINDAPVLARADVGVAMGGIGSDAAIEAADVVLMRDDPLALALAIRIAKKTKRILYQNIVLALGIKSAVLILSVFGFATMWMGVFADVGVTLLAVLNAMRALAIKQ
ncbi:MAG: cadmium-translocating P-type ATPase [Erysipelotrichaceae bacterium]|nr:cadmium-translocating P-type ATPase [Erysipelotrichaceae bacterium]